MVYIKKSTEYLTRRTVQVFIPLTRFLQKSFVSSNFLVLLRYSFLIFSFISTCMMVSASNIPKYLLVSFLRAFRLQLDLVVRLLPSFVVCQILLLAWHIFLCQIPCLYLDCIFSQFVLGFPILFCFGQKVSCRPCTSSGWSFPAIYWVCIQLCIS